MIQGLMRIFPLCRWPIIFPRTCVEGLLKAFVSTREEQSVMRLLHFFTPLPETSVNRVEESVCN